MTPEGVFVFQDAKHPFTTLLCDQRKSLGHNKSCETFIKIAGQQGSSRVKSGVSGVSPTVLPRLSTTSPPSNHGSKSGKTVGAQHHKYTLRAEEQSCRDTTPSRTRVAPAQSPLRWSTSGAVASDARPRFGAWLDNHLCALGGSAWKATPDRDGSFRPLIEKCSRTCRCVKVRRRNNP